MPIAGWSAGRSMDFECMKTNSTDETRRRRNRKVSGALIFFVDLIPDSHETTVNTHATYNSNEKNC
jgi:hypothetical protein